MNLSNLFDVSVECLPEDMPIEGNASAIDDETDAEIARDIRDQLEQGNPWAWCTVRVSVSTEIAGMTFQRDNYLGGCSYKSEEDFKKCGYFTDMVAECSDDLAEDLKNLRIRLHNSN